MKDKVYLDRVQMLNQDSFITDANGAGELEYEGMACVKEYKKVSANLVQFSGNLLVNTKYIVSVKPFTGVLEVNHNAEL